MTLVSSNAMKFVSKLVKGLVCLQGQGKEGAAYKMEESITKW